MFNYDAYIFDFGGLFIEVDYQKAVGAFEDLGLASFDKLYSQSAQTSIFDHLEIGQMSASRFVNELLTMTSKEISPNQVIHAWNSMLGDIIADNVKFLDLLLEQNKELFLFSNTNEIHIQLAFNRWENQNLKSPMKIFKKIYLSHELGMRKPNRESFDFIVKENGLNPKTTLFIDDSLQHIHGAQKAGLNALHVISNSKLENYFS